MLLTTNLLTDELHKHLKHKNLNLLKASRVVNEVIFATTFLIIKLNKHVRSSNLDLLWYLKMDR